MRCTDMIYSLYKSGEYSDLKIHCGDVVFPVHKAIVCPRSAFFASACSWGKVSAFIRDVINDLSDKFQEAELKDDISWADEDSKIVKLMIDYLYELDYNAEPFTSNKAGHSASSESTPQNDDVTQPLSTDPKNEKLVTNVLVYALADKYGINDLKLLAQSKFDEAVKESWMSEAFVRSAELAFSNTPSDDFGIRSIVINTLNDHRALIGYEEVQELLGSENGMAWQLAKVVIKQQGSTSRMCSGYNHQRCYGSCRYCGRTLQ